VTGSLQICIPVGLHLLYVNKIFLRTWLTSNYSINKPGIIRPKLVFHIAATRLLRNGQLDKKSLALMCILPFNVTL
jgi:hypothetical protein